MLQNAQADSKIIFRLNYDMNHQIIPVDEDQINQGFEPVNDSFGGFREFTSDLFFQIVDFGTPFFNSLLNVQFF